MTLAERYELAADSTLLERVKLAAVRTALNVAAEDPATELHAERRDLARRVVQAPQAWADVLVFGVLCNPNVGTGRSDPAMDTPEGDSALEFVLASIWNAYT